ncbi:MAG: ATP-binding protein [Bryobacter sp.]|jgi:signal transduction histidine kinase|nr:ATP-binding protein [Bryobacter sp.]
MSAKIPQGPQKISSGRKVPGLSLPSPASLEHLRPADEPSGRFGRRFANLRVRPKLMILHNLFFLALALSVYFSLIPLVEKRVLAAKAREIAVVSLLLQQDAPLLRRQGLEAYRFEEGGPGEVRLTDEQRNWLDEHPGLFLRKEDAIIRKDPRSGLYRRVEIPNEVYEALIERARFTLFLVLGVIYCVAVAVLELVVMPKFVYRPLRWMLDADQATLRNQRERELIPERAIFADEIGQIMRSRNRTVTELRRHEDELETALKEVREKNEQLETAKQTLAEQDRLASLGLLSASVAHEMNTPLAVLQGSIEKLAETVADPQAQERLARMRRVAQRLKSISESLVDFARVRTEAMESVALRPLIEESWHLVAIDEKAGGAVFTNAVAPEHAVRGNADRLAQVFVNLLRNALDAIPAGGTVRVASSRLGGVLHIRVEDNGPGIPPDVLPEIFEAFVSKRLDAKGTGLGLTVAEGIVRQHHGTITAANRPEGGACLEVTLPIA